MIAAPLRASAPPRAQEPDRAVLDLQVFAAEPAAMERWLASAPARAVAQYAGGPDLPHDAPGVALARDWAGAGLVTLGRQRDPRDERRWLFLMIRSDTALHAPPARAVDRNALRALLALLRHRAARGRSCPSNGEIARELGLRSRRAAGHLFDRLIAEGAIRVESRGTRAARVVTIVKSGKETRR